MTAFEVILLLLAVCAVLRLVAERIAVPYVTLLVVGGFLLALIPGLPSVEISPDLMFIIFIPPLLYAGALTFPLRDFRSEVGAIIRLAVLLVIVSTIAVAITVHALNPAFTWAAAITLGAIVAPPDAAAVLSAVRSLRLSRRIQSILEGESMFNDATALIMYRAAIAAAVTATFSPSNSALQFFIDAAGGVGIGLVVGWFVVRVQSYAQRVPVAAITVYLLTPFIAYLPAEQLGVSGILAVVTAGMFIAQAVPRIDVPATRLQITATRSSVTFILESLIFIFVGLELPHAARALQRQPISFLLWEAAAVSACLIVVRFAWVIPSALYLRRLENWLRHSKEPLPTFREAVFVAWAGLRGGDSLVLALALPFVTASGARFPARDEILFITFCVIFITLVLQGSTLAPLARKFGIMRDRSDDREEAHARLTAAEAGLRSLQDPKIDNSPHPEVVRYLRSRHRQRARRWAAREQEYARDASAHYTPHNHAIPAPSHEAGELDEKRAAEYRRVRSVMIQAERQALIELRDEGELADDILRRVQRDLDMEAVLLDTREPVVDSASEVPAALDSNARREDE